MPGFRTGLPPRYIVICLIPGPLFCFLGRCLSPCGETGVASTGRKPGRKRMETLCYPNNRFPALSAAPMKSTKMHSITLEAGLAAGAARGW